MEQSSITYQTYKKILEKELVPAMGCTEPIALAYCSAKARSILGMLPTKVEIQASGNIIKNVKSVIVPHTHGHKGIEAAAAIGIVAGNEELELEVLRDITDEQIEIFQKYLNETEFSVKQSDSDLLLDIVVKVYYENSYAMVRIINYHTNIVYIEKNRETILDLGIEQQIISNDLNYELLNVKDIYDFAETVRIEDIREIIDQQIKMNTAIAEDGLSKNYGANIGSLLLDIYGNDVRNRAKAKASAGSDARMNGSEFPVVINSGSGNQGITVSLPVIEYAREYHVSQDKLYRALIISNLTAIHQKNRIGYLSAYCGAVSAGAAAGGVIAFLRGGDYDDISHTIVNALAITSGIVCDGAKSSCAAKIATAIDAGILGYEMYKKGKQFYDGEGVVSKGVENTIRNIGLLGREGMKETDKEILCIMTCFD